MKYILKIALLFISIECVSQNPVVSLYNKNGSRVAGSYYKDVNNDLEQFEGTWLYVNGTTSLQIIFVKKTMAFNSSYYEDLIIGEYIYIEDNLEKINTLSNINVNYGNQRRHTISGNTLINNSDRPFCNNCALNQKRLRLSLSENEYFTNIFAKIEPLNNPVAMKVKILRSHGMAHVEGDIIADPEPIIPSGEHLLIKQP